MKVIIDPYRGGSDTGVNISGKYEKNLLLNLSNYLSKKLTELGVENEIVRTSDVSLSDDERNSIINELKNSDDIIIQNRYIEDEGDIEIIYPLRNSDRFASEISRDLENSGFRVEKYYQRRLPSNTLVDYYSVIRNTSPNETLIIEYNDLVNYQKVVDVVAEAIASYIGNGNTYIVQAGDSLYQIAKKYNSSVDEIKKENNLSSNILSIGQVLKVPVVEEDDYLYTVVKGDSLYQIAKKYNSSVDEIKSLNNLKSNLLSVGQVLKIPR